jgi:PEP-CTERM motif
MPVIFLKNIYGNKMKKQSIVALFAVGAAFASNMALADTITINQTFDLTFPDAQSAGLLAISSDNFASVLVRTGDTVVLNYTFAAGQALQVSSTGSAQTFGIGLWQDNPASPENSSVFSIGNASFNLIGANGSFPGSVAVSNQSGGRSNLGPTLTGSFMPNNGTVNFTGLRATFDVTSLQNGQSFYNAGYFSVAADSVAVTTPVPEPETYAMMIAGLGMLAFLAKRRKAA